jgi:hypothetical protein
VSVDVAAGSTSKAVFSPLRFELSANSLQVYEALWRASYPMVEAVDVGPVSAHGPASGDGLSRHGPDR